jgi:acyl-CoA reductase-like NAD-dependent aldehyde dehydrogenase
LVSLAVPESVCNYVGGNESPTATGEWFTKLNPATGKPLTRVARSREADVRCAIRAAKDAQTSWAAATPVRRGDLLRDIALELDSRKKEIAALVAAETGKSLKDAMGETSAAVEMGMFVAGEGRRFYGRTTTSAVPNKNAMTIRQPLGVAGLIIAANTPIANVAWKVFPALLCGNAAVLKPAEDTPLSAWAFARIAADVGLPKGILNVVHGFGPEAGAPLVESPDVAVVSFTGSSEVGRYIARTVGDRLGKVCLELGGKNPLIVCADADLPRAVESAALSAFSNAGQRCAAGSRIIVFSEIYDRFREMLVARAESMKVGPGDTDDFGPVINEEQLSNMLGAITQARKDGARVLTGGVRLTGTSYDGGFYIGPTIIEGVSAESAVSQTELFGPITCLYRVGSFEEALSLADSTSFGLTAAIHTKDINRAMSFLASVKSGVAVVNGGTYGSEPHMPFGGLRQSGNGFREAGTEALDVYSDWKTIYVNFDPQVV